MEFSNCKWCGKQLDARNGDECYQCFVTRLEVERNPEIALKVLAHLTPLALDAATARANFPTCDRALRSNWVALATPRK